MARWAHFLLPLFLAASLPAPSLSEFACPLAVSDSFCSPTTTTTTTPPTPTPPPISASVLVRGALTFDPLVGATVKVALPRLSSLGIGPVNTGEDGSAQLGSIPAGTVVLVSATLGGFEPLQLELALPDDGVLRIFMSEELPVKYPRIVDSWVFFAILMQI